MATWVYPHRDLDEPVFADGSPILRPVVPLILSPDRPDAVAVLDSGSPLSVADADLFAWLGVDVEVDEPLYELPNAIGGRFVNTRVFEVEMALRPPGTGESVVWRLALGARPDWRLPCPVLLGQRGWFDRFPTRIDGSTSSVEVLLGSDPP